MKKKWRVLLVAIGTLIGSLGLVGCMGDGDTPPPIDYNADIVEVQPEDIEMEHFVKEEEKTYYSSSGLSLWMEVKGAFLKMDYFTLDGKKRVYDNLQFFKGDYFYMLSDDMVGWYAALSDSSDSEYAEEELAEGEEYSINIIKEGIYTVIFDTETLKFDLIYKSEITTPVYYTIKACEIYTSATSWVEMSVNPDNEDELMIENFSVAANESITFYSKFTHTSFYKVSLDPSCSGHYGYPYPTDERFTYVLVGGAYNIYLNRKTYVVRMELLDTVPPTYSLMYYDTDVRDFVELTPYDTAVPYVFRYQMSVDTTYTSVPQFYTTNAKPYKLTVADSNLVYHSGERAYIKAAGEYELIINLQTFEITVELLPE